MVEILEWTANIRQGFFVINIQKNSILLDINIRNDYPNTISLFTLIDMENEEQVTKRFYWVSINSPFELNGRYVGKFIYDNNCFFVFEEMLEP